MPNLLRIAFSAASLLFASTLALAQDMAYIDSLMTELSIAEGDTSFIDINLDIGSEYLFNSPDTASHFIDEAFRYAVNSDDTINIAECYNLYGIIGTIQGKYVTGIENFQQSLTWYELAGDNQGASNIINNIGVIYGYLDNYSESIKHYKKSYQLSLTIQDTSGAALNLFNVAADYIELENYDSLLHYTELLEEFQNGEDTYISTAPLKAEYFIQVEMLDSAESCYKRALDYNLGRQDQVQAMSTKLGLAEIYTAKDELDDALTILDDIYDFSLAHEFNENLLEVLKLRSEIFEKQGKFEPALAVKADFIVLKDSLDKINNFNRINELNAKYDAEKKEKELAEMTAIMAESQANKKAQDRVYITIGACVLLVILLLMISLFRKKRVNKILNAQNNEISLQRQKIVSSINYAKKIQNSILIPEQIIQEYLPESFVYFKPKDIVSGDFYWFSTVGEKIIMATIDCTGHGVPGAFMSLIANSKLSKVVNELGIFEPSEILSRVHKEIVISLNQEINLDSAQDGMDMSLCVIDKANGIIKYAGAQNSIFLVNGDAVSEIKADHLSIGGTFLSNKLNGSFKFTTKEIQFDEGSTLFMFTDGYMDQFGGERDKKLNKSNFKDLIQQVANRSLTTAKEHVEDYLKQWMGTNPQVDDILIIGARL